jgi:ceramide glucosyltransferase
MNTLALAFGLLATFSLVLHLASTALVLWRYSRPAPPLTLPAKAAPSPLICLLRPVCGVDAFDVETLTSSFLQDYPDYEVIFCAALPDDPAVALVQRLIAAHPQVRARLLIGDDRISGNPKLNNLAKGWAATTADWIVMADSNLLLPRNYLATLMASWTPDTGLVSSPPIGIRPEGLWGAVECAFLNSNQARWQAAADSLGFGFAQGKTLFWRRDVVEAGGGLAALGNKLAEDVASTKLVRGAGLRVTLTRHPFAQPIGRRSFSTVWGRQLRWSRVRRDGFPMLFGLEVLNGPVAPFATLIAAVAITGASVLWAPVYLALWYGAEIMLMRSARWPAGPLDMIALPIRDALAPALWLDTFLGKGFEWRGTAMAPSDTVAE